MNAGDFRNLYEYHFDSNRKIWERCIVPLTDNAFKQKVNYSVGSIRNQTVHMMNVDERWFCGLRGVEIPPFINPTTYKTREAIREKWDEVETMMRAYLSTLTDEDLKQTFEKWTVWQTLFHVVNHGTDHRAQLLSALHTAGAATFAQDYFFFAYTPER